MLRRTRLESLLAESSSRRLTAIVGGTGSGKTTLLSHWADRRPVSWHTLTEGDRSLSALARNVVDRLRLLVPDLSAEILLAIEGEYGPDPNSSGQHRADAIAAAMAQDLEAKLTSDLFLVLDDLHVLDRSGESQRFLAALVRQAPARLHVVMASRDSLPFPIGRLAVEGQVVELGSDELAFTRTEIQALLDQTVGEHPSDADERILERTGGWAAATAFAARVVSLEGSFDDSLGEDSQRSLFEYLADEVLGSERKVDVEALRFASELPWITPELAQHLEMGSSGERLFSRERMRIYVTASNAVPAAVSVSPLVRDFLLRNRPLPTDARSGLHRKAGRWFAQGGWDLEALGCLAVASDRAALEGLLESRGEAILASGLARQIVAAIASFDGDPLAPSIRLLEAEARQVLGDWEGATTVYEELTPTSGPIPAGLAWRIGLLFHMRGDVDGALEAYQRGSLGGDDPEDQSALLGWQAAAYWLRGDRVQAQALAERALDLAREAGNHRALATAHTVLAMVAALDGDRARNDIHYLRALEHAEIARDVIQTIRIRSNRGSHFLEQGELDRASTEVETALRLADMTGSELWRAMALTNRAQIQSLRGRLEEAVADLVQSREIFRNLGSNLESYPLSHLGDVYALRGDLALARTAYQQAIALSEKPDDLQALIPALAGLSRVVLSEDLAEAEQLADRATQVASVLGHVRALLAVGHVALAKGDKQAARLSGERAADVARARMDLPGLAEAVELMASATDKKADQTEFLDQAKRIWDEIGSKIGASRVVVAQAALDGGSIGQERVARAAMELEELGAIGLAQEARKLLTNLEAEYGSDIAIRTLGGIGFYRMGEPIPSSEWQSRTAREILAMLVANRGRALHRDVLIDRFWPDDDLAKASNRLSVALTTIRRVFDPNREKPPDWYVVADLDSVSLNLDHMWVDVDVFLDAGDRGRALLRSGDVGSAIEAFKTAERLYIGAFLEEYLYSDWSTALREEARSEYMSIMSDLASWDLENGNFDSAARRYLRILEEDAYNEPAHVALVTSMSRAGRHGTARRLYGIYVTRMGELEVEPAPFPAVG